MERRLITLALFCILTLLTAQTAAAAVTQGQFAVALAQVLGFDVSTVSEALAAMATIQVQPDAGWAIEKPVTRDTYREIENAIKRAVAAGLLTPDRAEGAMAAASAALKITFEPTGPGEKGSPIGGTPTGATEGSKYNP